MNLWTRLAQFQFFETERLIFRPFMYADGPAFFEIASNPSNLTFIFPEQKTLEESQFALANYFMKEPLGVWAICRKDGSMIGAIRFEKIDQIKLQAELGYFLKESDWGQGLMTEAVRELLNLSFKHFGLERILLICHQENEASQRVALKAGFKLNRSFKGSDRYSRKMRDYLEFHYLKGDFYEQAPGHHQLP